MAVKVACLEYADKPADIPIRFDLFRRSPKLLDWYVKKYNPFALEELSLPEASVYKVVVPFLAQEQTSNPDKATLIMEKTVYALADLGIQYVALPKKYTLPLPTVLPIANHRMLFPFFMMPSILKGLSLVGQDIKHAEILLIDGDPYLTEIIIDAIYGHINYLTIMTDADNLPFYHSMAEDIFDDNGLLIQIVTTGKTAARTADVVINTSDTDYKLDYSFKKNALYFELSSNTFRAMELFHKRPDLLAVDNLRLSLPAHPPLDLPLFEAYFYSLSPDYRYMLNRRYSVETGTQILQTLKKQDARVKALYCQDKVVTVTR